MSIFTNKNDLYKFIVLLLVLSMLFVGCSSQPVTNQPTPEPTKQERPVQQETKSQPEQTQQSTSPAPTVKQAPVMDKQETTVYVTNTGSKYHSAGCRYLSKSQIPISLSDAKGEGYAPCSKCGPPR